MTESKSRRRSGHDREQAAHDRLRAALRRGDPRGDGRAPTGSERAALRRRIVEAAGASSAAPRAPLPAIAFALVAVAALAVASLLWLEPAGHDDIDAGKRPSTVATGDPATEIDGSAPPAVRNVQFVTRGGTRIVWVLNRNLDI